MCAQADLQSQVHTMGQQRTQRPQKRVAIALRADDGPTLNVGLCDFSGNSDQLRNPIFFVIFSPPPFSLSLDAPRCGVKKADSEMSRSSQGLDCFQIQGYLVGLLPKLRHAPPSTFLFVYVGNYRQWRFSTDAQAHLSLPCSHMQWAP